MADTVIENLITKISLKVDQGIVDKFNDGIEVAAKGLATIVAAAGAASTAIFAFTKKMAESNDTLGKFSQTIGVDVEALQELGYVAELNGGSIDSMNSSLANLTKLMSEAARGTGAGVEVFGLLNLSIKDVEGGLKTADEMLFDVADSIAKLGTQAEKLELAQKLGIGENLLLAIQQGSDAIRKQRQEARELGFVIDENATLAAADFNDELLRTTKVIYGVANAIGTRLMKQITPMIKEFTNWFKVNKQLIQQDIGNFLERVTIFAVGVRNVVSRVIGVINYLVSAIGGWKAAIISITAVWGVLNANVLLTPALVLAAGAGILLLLEDIQKFAEGGDSAVGDLAEKYPVFDSLLRGTLTLLGKVIDGWTLLFTRLDDLILGSKLLFGDFLGWIDDIGNSIAEKLIAPLNGAIDLLNKIPGINLGKFNLSSIRTPPTTVSPVPQSIMNQQSNQLTNNTVTNNPTFNISVQEGTKENVEQAIESVIQRHYNSAQTNLSSNVEY